MMCNNKRLKEGEVLRQEALDYIIKHPGCFGPEVAFEYGWNISSCTSRLQDMTDRGELRRVRDHYGRTFSYRYWHIVEKTITWEALASSAYGAREYRKKPEPKPPKAKEPWITRNNDPERMPIKNQGGQGRVRRDSWGRQEAPSWT